jgi:hypothetical protein
MTNAFDEPHYQMNILPKKLFALLVCLLVLTGCGNLPRPFAPDSKKEGNPLLMLTDRGGVVVRPVEGLAPDDAAMLAARTIDALQKQNVPAMTGRGNATSYVLDGVLRPAPDGSASVVFQLVDPRGVIITNYIATLPPRAGAAGLTRVAQETAMAMAEHLQPNPANGAPTTIVLRRVVIGEVTGAPGGENGSRALTRALAYALQRVKVPVADKPDGETLAVSGSVKVTPKPGQVRNVAFRWVVLNAEGAELGKVDMANDVPMEYLDRGWAELANAVAEAAADGIADIVERTPAKR